jgi:biotin carboxylase
MSTLDRPPAQAHKICLAKEDMQKRILILPAAHFQLSVIKYAKSQGYYVVTSDNDPSNPGHDLADASYDVSTTDHEGTLKIAREEKIDGVLAYASDPAAPTAAYVAEQMGLPGNPYQAVKTLATKSLYRKFLQENGFQHPPFVAIPKSYSENEARGLVEKTVTYPVMVKPVDRSGSKGVTKVNGSDGLAEALQIAREYTLSGDLIVEDYVNKHGPQIGGEAYVVDGKIEMLCLGEQQVASHLGRPHLPVGMIFPARLKKDQYAKIRAELQRAIDLLDYRFGALNLEIMISTDGEVYLMEIGPRSGGNMLPELMSYTANADVPMWCVEHALGHGTSKYRQRGDTGVYGYYVLHSEVETFVTGSNCQHVIHGKVVNEMLVFGDNKAIQPFSNSGDLAGIWMLEFNSYDQASMFYETSKLGFLTYE